jgi:hypothetical protein
MRLQQILRLAGAGHCWNCRQAAERFAGGGGGAGEFGISDGGAGGIQYPEWQGGSEAQVERPSKAAYRKHVIFSVSIRKEHCVSSWSAPADELGKGAGWNGPAC